MVRPLWKCRRPAGDLAGFLFFVRQIIENDCGNWVSKPLEGTFGYNSVANRDGCFKPGTLDWHVDLTVGQGTPGIHERKGERC